MLAISQNPDRVSNILRSSTAMIRGSGIGRGSGAAVRAAAGRAARHGDGGAHAAAPSRWVSAVSSRNISSRPAPSAAPQLDQRRCRRRRRPGRPARGRRRRAARRRRRGGWRCRRRRAPGPGAARSAVRTKRAGGREQLGLGALRDDAAVADHDEVVGDDLDLVQQVRGQQHRAAAVGVARGAGRASSGCRPGRGRWPARRGSAPPGRRSARSRCRAAGACRASSCGPAGGRLGRREADQVEHLVDAAARAAPWCAGRW